MLSRPGPQPLPRAALILLAGALMAVGCGELETPEAYAPPTSVAVEADGVEQETASQVQEQPGLAAQNDEFVPPPAEYVPTLLVSGENSLLAADGTATVTFGGPLEGLATTQVVDDLFGGLVIQELDGPIVYRPAQGEPEILDDEGARLLDIGWWDGSPRAFVEAAPGRIEWIQLAQRTAGQRERQVHLQLAEGEEIVAFSASRSLQAVITSDDRCGTLRFYNSEGQLVDFRGPDDPECIFPRRPVFGAVALSPAADAVAYTIVSYRGDGTEAATELVARELRAGSVEFFNRRVGEDLDVVLSLTFDGERAAYLKRSGQTQSVTILPLAVDSVEIPVDLLDAGSISAVSFARIPVTPVG
jgi:hypothetical protein